jgi:hypothetical protein
MSATVRKWVGRSGKKNGISAVARLLVPGYGGFVPRTRAAKSFAAFANRELLLRKSKNETMAQDGKSGIVGSHLLRRRKGPKL